MMKRRCRTCVVSRKRWNAAKLSLHPEKCSYERINRSLIRLTQCCIFQTLRSSHTSRASVSELTLPAVMMTEMLERLLTLWIFTALESPYFFFCWWVSHECNSLCLLKDSSSLTIFQYIYFLRCCGYCCRLRSSGFRAWIHWEACWSSDHKCGWPSIFGSMFLILIAQWPHLCSSWLPLSSPNPPYQTDIIIMQDLTSLSS